MYATFPYSFSSALFLGFFFLFFFVWCVFVLANFMVTLGIYDQYISCSYCLGCISVSCILIFIFLVFRSIMRRRSDAPSKHKETILHIKRNGNCTMMAMTMTTTTILSRTEKSFWIAMKLIRLSVMYSPLVVASEIHSTGTTYAPRMTHTHTHTCIAVLKI